jgi:hypothetical protein
MTPAIPNATVSAPTQGPLVRPQVRGSAGPGAAVRTAEAHVFVV